MYKLIINLKTYEESTGVNALNIAKAAKELESYASEKNVEIVLCPQTIDMSNIIETGISTYAQHIDNKNQGQTTGYNVPKNFKSIGAKGTLISHSERNLEVNEIEELIKIAKENSLETCVCARDAQRANEVSKFNPDYIAVEPQELIGGDISISTAQPELIEESLNQVGDVSLLVGAGVKTTEDVSKSIELGAKGILVASGVVKSDNPKEEIKKLLDGF